MELRGHVLPSNYAAQPPLDESSGLLSSTSRQPLTASTGNSQLQALSPVSIYHDHKDHSRRPERSMYSTPTVPSIPPSRSLADARDRQRRRAPNRRQHRRPSRNPIADSPHYQAYRARQQNRDSNGEDAKWPDELEAAFLDAIVKIPPIGRGKFSYRGKPHGRNELIKEYIWLAYLQSLPPGQAPDQRMMRTRKQVSSHIQVLKTFFKGHPAFDQLFPKGKTPKNGFEHSYKNDPCLRALAEGRLPDDEYDNYGEILPNTDSNQSSTMPTLFWLLITSTSIPTDNSAHSTSEEDLYHSGLVAHKYTSLSTQQPRESIEYIFNWQHRFPKLLQLYKKSYLINCDIIHMDVALSLMSSHPPEGAELVSRTELSIPNSSHDLDYDYRGFYLNDTTWQIITTLRKPPELCRDPAVDPPVESQTSIIPVLSMSTRETRIKVPFPANAWAHAFTSLTDMTQKSGFNSSLVAHALNEISMFQEVQSCPGPGQPFTCRAIILWTFHKSGVGEPSCANWRYLEGGSPSRRECMSPDPGMGERAMAGMNENFGSSFLGESTQQGSIVDPFIQQHHQHHHTGLATPPATTSLHSPFENHSQPVYEFGVSHHGHFDMPAENLSFSTTTTVDSESTLVGSEATGIENFLANNGVSVGLGSFEDQRHSWSLEGHVNATESFDGLNSWSYSNFPNSAPHQFGGWEDIGADAKASGQIWMEPDLKHTIEHEWTEQNVEEKVKELEWVVELPSQRIEEGSEWGRESQEETQRTSDEEGTIEERYELIGSWVDKRPDSHEDITQLHDFKNGEKNMGYHDANTNNCAVAGHDFGC